MDTTIVFMLIVIIMQFFIICSMYNKINKIGKVIGVTFLTIQEYYEEHYEKHKEKE